MLLILEFKSLNIAIIGIIFRSKGQNTFKILCARVPFHAVPQVRAWIHSGTTVINRGILKLHSSALLSERDTTLSE